MAVVDAGGVLVGLISDRDLLGTLREHWSAGHAFGGGWSFLRGRRGADATALAGITAREVMTTDLFTAPQDAPVEEAIRLMTTHGLKRLPVVDGEGRYLGMLSRDALLRAGLQS